MKRLFKILPLLFLISCSDKQVETINQSNPPDSTTATNTVEKGAANICRPSELFIALIEHMDSSSYHVDSATISKTTEQFDRIKLNPVLYENSFIHSLLKDSAVFADLSSVDFHPKYDQDFGKVKCIWTFDWRIPDAEDGLKRRGTVEEWAFDSDSSAKFAYDFLINEYKKLGFPFCKTPGFYVQCNKYLYLFHSNHTGVGYRHKPFHKWLTAKCSNIK